MSEVHDARAVANKLLDLADALDLSLDTLGLQKIIFFSHGLWLAKHNRPLVIQAFEAWDYGPVVRVVYKAFKKVPKGSGITSRANLKDFVQNKNVLATSDFSGEELAFLKDILEFYGKIDSISLMRLTHQLEGPWDKIRSTKVFSVGGVIENYLIQDYFRGTEHLHPTV